MQFATGALSALLPKLGQLLKDEYDLQRSVKKGVQFLISELEIMKVALEKVSDVPLDQLDKNVKIWARDVRELSYNMEDIVDTFMLRVDSQDPTSKNKAKKLLNKCCHLVSNLKTRHTIANKIEGIKSQIKEVRDRYNRYKIDGIDAQHRPTIDPRIFALYEKNLVGIEKARDDLIVLSKVTDLLEEKLTMTSVVGFGGLGKTTLAKVVFDMHKGHFGYAGFVPIGQKPDMKKVFKDMFIAIGENGQLDHLDERQLIDKLGGCLEKKRYLIVIDDIWEKDTWSLMKLALVDGKHGSRVIITTRISEVAQAVGNVYEMKPLSDDNSRKLFNSRVIGDKYKGLPDDQSDDAMEKIIKKCGGVPLAIITIASLLVDIPTVDWSKVYDSIGFGPDDKKGVVQNMRKIISFSYYNLPSHLRTCLLYLSIFPEDQIILKDPLIWMWIAEDFVKEENEKWLFEIGEGYFAELINRSMIQPVEDMQNMDGTVGGCRIHDMVLDFIRTMVTEEKFVQILDRAHQENFSGSQSATTVRRLAWHKGEWNLTNDGVAKHLRTFTAIWHHISVMPPLESFQALRVLALEYYQLMQDFEVKHIGKLRQLRYLGLNNIGVRELPMEIGDLMHLLALEIVYSELKELPETISKLRNLRRLRVQSCPLPDCEFKLSLRNLTTLEDLFLDGVDLSPELALELGKLTNLRLLYVGFQLIGGCSLESVMESLRGLRKLQNLTLKRYSGFWSWPSRIILDSNFCDGWQTSRQLSKLDMGRCCELLRLPQWVKSTFIPYLSSLTLNLQGIDTRDMEALARMPALRYLSLYIKERSKLVVPGGGFLSLKICHIQNTFLTFLTGAMPMLVKVYFCVLPPSCGGAAMEDLGIGNLHSLQEAVVFLDDLQFTTEEVEECEEAFRRVVDAHPNHPRLRFKVPIGKQRILSLE